jgi:hypothetical protein
MSSGVVHGVCRALVVLGVIVAPIARGDEPEWVRKRPISQEFYIGIGMARKAGPAAEYAEAARNVALNDIASQITVAVSSDVLRTVLEKNERLEEEFQSRIRASATADLEGVRVIDTYESDADYWVYCRLSRAEYAARRRAKLDAAAAQSLDLYSRGKNFEREGKAGQALGLYAGAFGPIEAYLAEPLAVEAGGQTVYLVNELYNSLGSLLGRIEITAIGGERDVKVGRPLKAPLELKAALGGAGAPPAPDLPFRFAFTRGAGDHVDRVRTDHQGIARCAVQKITAADRIQIVEATLDLLALAGGEQTPPVVRTVLSSFTPPGARFVLNVSGVDVCVDAEESVFGKPLEQKRIEPQVKSELAARNFSFVADRSRASLLVTIRADARKGTETFGLAFAFASATVSVLDLETGQEVYKSAINEVKEGSDSFDKAAFKAMDTLARRIVGEVVPRLVDKVQE